MLALRSEPQDVIIGGKVVKDSRNSRVAFALRCHWSAISRRHFIYDSAGLASAHLLLGKLRVPYLAWMHGIEVWGEMKPLAKAALIRADLVLANSNYTIEKYRERHGDLAQAKVCWLGTEEDEPPERCPSFLGPPTVLIVSRMEVSEEYKGHSELIAAWPRVVSAVPGAKLLIVGTGPGTEYVRALAARSTAYEQIELIGFVSDRDLPSIWARTHVFAMPSAKEGFGLVYVEAMRYSIPVIGSVRGAAPEVNIHGVTGYNVDLEKKGDLAEHIIHLLRSPDLCRDVGRLGLENWKEHFRFSAFRKRLTPLLEEFVSRG
jgi:phosphatidylinositol alpha-1,6-mannosyltransferase